MVPFKAAAIYGFDTFDVALQQLLALRQLPALQQLLALRQLLALQALRQLLDPLGVVDGAILRALEFGDKNKLILKIVCLQE